MLVLDEYELFDLQPVAELEVRGCNRYRSTGTARLAAKTPTAADHRAGRRDRPRVRVPLTAVLRIDAPIAGIRARDLHARADVFASLETQAIDIGGQSTPLEAEPTAAFAAGLTESKFWEQELRLFLGNAIGVRKRTALGGLRPYKRGRTPVVFVHGTASSPARWADMVNDLLADPRLRERYAFWFFTYDSGNPIGYSAFRLRDALTQAVDRADPSGHDPCARDMVVLGHSQGGLLTKLTAIDSGNTFWAGISDKPFDDVKLAPDDKVLLRNVVFVKPLPFVTEVIFLATPQRGSYLAGPQFVRRLAERLVRLPSDVVRVSTDLLTQMPRGASDVAFSNVPTSIDNMSPGNRFIKTLAQIPVGPTVRAHSIIAVDDDSPLDVAGDGVVKYQSAHVEGVDSELIVRSPHSGMQAAPQTIEEVRRILVEHSERSACPLPQ
jgi:pimeloyl-ACP methyl ester carboxylesterase